MTVQQVARADESSAAWLLRVGRATALPPPLAAQPHRSALCRAVTRQSGLVVWPGSFRRALWSGRLGSRGPARGS